MYKVELNHHKFKQKNKPCPPPVGGNLSEASPSTHTSWPFLNGIKNPLE
jgi:hypothetical protein